MQIFYRWFFAKERLISNTLQLFQKIQCYNNGKKNIQKWHLNSQIKILRKLL